ncbi:MAG: hypothetical protein U1E10_11585, partial [Bdellovibrionales bacterium]|nr:hypothetical protein [Bdellovibrionales bacterium]
MKKQKHEHRPSTKQLFAFTSMVALSIGFSFTASAQTAAVKPAKPSPPKLSIEFAVEKEVLPNGLTVLYHSDRSVP